MSRDCMEGYIRASGRYTLCASLANAGLAELACTRLPVDLILMDVCTEGEENGIDAAAAIKRRLPHIRVIIVTSMVDAAFLDKAREAGAESFWYKEASAGELIEVMDRTMRGESVYPLSAPCVRIGNASSSEFTRGELDVLRLLIRGLPDAAIAETLHIGVPAVRWHLKNLFEKTGYDNRVSLACDVIDKDLIAPGV